MGCVRPRFDVVRGAVTMFLADATLTVFQGYAGIFWRNYQRQPQFGELIREERKEIRGPAGYARSAQRSLYGRR